MIVKAEYVSSFATTYIAVGVAQEKDANECVVLVTSDGTTLSMNENAARKLADDILRNANYLWGIEEETE